MILDGFNGQPLIILLIVIGAFALIAIVAFVIYRLLRPKLKDEGKEQKTEKDYAQEELDRILQPVEDEGVAKEISNDRKELQLLREKRILAETKSERVVELANEYEKQLEALFNQYMEEHLEDFIMGTKLIEEGRRAGDSDLIIQGNVIIQSRLGKEVQFTNQEEFDDFMDSDIPLIL